MFPMTLLILTMTSNLDRFTANKTSVSQLRIACLLPTAVLVDTAAAAAAATRLSACVSATPDDAVAHSQYVSKYVRECMQVIVYYYHSPSFCNTRWLTTCFIRFRRYVNIVTVSYYSAIINAIKSG